MSPNASNLLYIMHDTHFYSIWWLLLKEGCQSPGSTPYRRSCQELCIELKYDGGRGPQPFSKAVMQSLEMRVDMRVHTVRVEWKKK